MEYVYNTEHDQEADVENDGELPSITWNLSTQTWSLKVIVGSVTTELEAKVWATSFTNVHDGPKRDISLSPRELMEKKQSAGKKLLKKAERDGHLTSVQVEELMETVCAATAAIARADEREESAGASSSGAIHPRSS